MRLKVHLVRHAESVWNAERRIQGRGDPPLSRTGEEQARRVARRFEAGEISALYSSPAQRARGTADPIADMIQMPVGLDDRLLERDVGIFTGLTWAEATRAYPDFLARWRKQQSISMPHGEEDAAFRERTRAVFEKIICGHDGGQVIVVSHHGLIQMLLIHLLKIDSSLGRPFQLDHASITSVALDDGRICVERLNDIGHLAATER